MQVSRRARGSTSSDWGDRRSRIPMTGLGAGTGLVAMTLDRPKWLRLGPFRVPMRRLILSAEDQSGLVAALNSSTPRS